MTKIERFEKAQAAYRLADAKCDEIEIALAVKYGPRFQESWAARSERKALATARAAKNRAATRVFKALEGSPRDWMGGVPSHWVCAKLTSDDAFKSKAEALSVVPPLAYGSVSPMV